MDLFAFSLVIVLCGPDGTEDAGCGSQKIAVAPSMEICQEIKQVYLDNIVSNPGYDATLICVAKKATVKGTRT